jgi:ankyrin repeat protein
MFEGIQAGIQAAKDAVLGKQEEEEAEEDPVQAAANRALMQAVHANELGEVKVALSTGADPNYKDEASWTPLIRLARNQFSVPASPPRCIDELVGQKADLSYVDDNGWSVLHHAAQFGHTTFASAVLQILWSQKEDAIEERQSSSNLLGLSSYTVPVDLTRLENEVGLRPADVARDADMRFKVETAENRLSTLLDRHKDQEHWCDDDMEKCDEIGEAVQDLQLEILFLKETREGADLKTMFFISSLSAKLKDGIDFLNWTRCAVFQDALIEKMKDVCERVATSADADAHKAARGSNTVLESLSDVTYSYCYRELEDFLTKVDEVEEEISETQKKQAESMGDDAANVQVDPPLDAAIRVQIEELVAILQQINSTPRMDKKSPSVTLSQVKWRADAILAAAEKTAHEKKRGGFGKSLLKMLTCAMR